MNEFLDFVIKRWEKDMLREHSVWWKKLKALNGRKYSVSVLGLQSSGKSTLLNGIACYPILPALTIKGTTCPLILEYGDKPLLTAVTQSTREVKMDGLFSAEIFQQLLEYACDCMNEHVFSAENIYYFLPGGSVYETISPSDILMDRNDSRHGIILAMILLSAHFENNDSASDGLQGRRKSLMRLLGVKGELSCLRLKWNSKFLPQNVSFIDLPGLGSISSVKNSAHSLDETAKEWASKSDIIICMTTPEAIGGKLKEAYMSIYSAEHEYSPPLTVLTVNRADEAKSLDIARNSAKSILPSLHTPLYVISALAGEHNFVEDSLSIEATQYWRIKIFPHLKHFHTNEYETEKFKSLATDGLRKLYEHQYDCENPRGDLFPMSFKEFICGEIIRLCNMRFSQLLHTVMSSDSEAVAKLKALTAKDSAFMENSSGYASYIWGTISQNIADILTELYCTLEEILLSVRAADNEYNMLLSGLREKLYEALAQINTHFTETISPYVGSLESKCGLSLCSAIFPASRVTPATSNNDRVRTEIYSACNPSELAKFLTPTNEYANEILHRVANHLAEISGKIHEALERFCENMAGLPDSSFEDAMKMNITRDIFRRYFYLPIRQVSQEIMTVITRAWREVLMPEMNKQNTRINIDFATVIRGHVSNAFQKATLIRWGKTSVLLKGKLIRELTKSLVPYYAAEQFYSYLGSQADDDNAITKLRELQAICVEIQKKVRDMTNCGLVEITSPLYSDCMKEIKNDSVLLNEWQSRIDHEEMLQKSFL